MITPKPQSVKEVLDTVNSETLKRVSSKIGLRQASFRKADMVASLAGYFETRLRDYVDCLSPLERAFLAEAAYGAGRVDGVAFCCKHEADCPLAGEYGSLNNSTPLRLVFFRDEKGYAIPASLADRIRNVLPAPPPVKAKNLQELPAEWQPPKPRWGDPEPPRPVHCYEAEKTMFQELRRVLTRVQLGKVKITDKSRRPTDATVKALADALAQPDFALELPPEEREEDYEAAGAVRAHAWPVLLQQCGWARPRAGQLVLTDAGKKLLATMDLEEFLSGVENFWSDDDFDEFNRINHIRGQSGKARRYLSAPSERKYPIRAAMEKWPVGQWIGFAEAWRLIGAHGGRFQVCERDVCLYFSEPAYGHLGGSEDGIDRQYLRALLFESLATLGLIDVAYTYPHGLWPELGGGWGIDDVAFCGRYDGLLYVRLNPLGAYCLGVTNDYAPPVAETTRLFSVLPNLELAVTAAAEVTAGDRQMLESFASQTSERVWAIDRDRILDHLDAGGTIDDLRTFLRAHAANEVPETVLRFLADLEAKARAVKDLEDAVLIEFHDDTTAALVAHDSQAGKICSFAGENRVAVPKKNLRAFTTALKKLGYILPKSGAAT